MTQCVEQRRFGDFFTFHVGDIEDVDHLVQMRANLGDLQIESQVKQRFRNIVEQARAIVSKNGNDGVIF